MTDLMTDMTELRLQLTVARAALGRAEDFLANPATAAAAAADDTVTGQIIGILMSTDNIAQQTGTAAPSTAEAGWPAGERLDSEGLRQAQACPGQFDAPAAGGWRLSSDRFQGLGPAVLGGLRAHRVAEGQARRPGASTRAAAPLPHVPG